VPEPDYEPAISNGDRQTDGRKVGMTGSSKDRVPHDPNDLRLAAKAVRLTASGLPGGSEHADRLEAWADDMERLAPLEAAVLDALSEADLRTAAEFVSSYLTDESQAAIADRLEAAADALHALEAQDPTNNKGR
jgi:hypothetical protein